MTSPWSIQYSYSSKSHCYTTTFPGCRLLINTSPYILRCGLEGHGRRNNDHCLPRGHSRHTRARQGQARLCYSSQGVKHYKDHMVAVTCRVGLNVVKMISVIVPRIYKYVYHGHADHIHQQPAWIGSGRVYIELWKSNVKMQDLPQISFPPRLHTSVSNTHAKWATLIRSAV